MNLKGITMHLVATSSQETAIRCSEGMQPFGAVVTTSDYDSLREALLKLTPHVLFVDSGLSGFHGPSSIRDLHTLSPLTNIVVLSSGLSEDVELAMFIAGARGFCDSKCSAQEIKKVFTAVNNGQLWIRRSHISRLLDEVRSGARSAIQPKFHVVGTLIGLTPREHEIAVLVGSGNTNKQIARHLSITERTVKAHLSEIFRKLSVTDRLTLGLRVTALSQSGITQSQASPPDTTPTLKLIKSGT
jgi:DNA-binding NarL/FixJ family response regulator